MHFSKGNFEQTKKYFLNVERRFCSKSSYDYLLPFEEDFVALFIVVLPMIFEKEFGRFLMNSSERSALNHRFLRRAKMFTGTQKRDVPSFLIAHLNHMLSQSRIEKRYLKSIVLAELDETKHDFISTLGFYWLGVYQADKGDIGKAEQSLSRALSLSRQHNLLALSESVEQTMNRRCLGFEKNHSSDMVKDDVSRFDSFPTDLAKEHLLFTGEALRVNKGFKEDLLESVAMVKSHYSGSQVHVLVFEEDQYGGRSHESSEFFYSTSSESTEKKIKNFIYPYLDISSTLLVPSEDFNLERKGSVDSNSTIVNANSVQETLSLNNGHDEKTVVANLDETLNFSNSDTLVPDVGSDTISLDLDNTDIAATVAIEDKMKSQSKNDLISMTALVPLIFKNGNIGIIAIEDIGEVYRKNASQSREELNFFGAQLAFLYQSKANYDLKPALSRPKEFLEYKDGAMVLENNDWLKIWHNGQLRKERESAWFLGLKTTDDNYILNFCQIIGRRSIRDQLSYLLWSYMSIVKVLGSEKNSKDLINLYRTDISFLMKELSGCEKLDSISFVSTIFDQKRKTVYSGHFGPARPINLGADNRILPLNNAVLRLENGNSLRYWSIESELSKDVPYILSFDTGSLSKEHSEQKINQLKRDLTSAKNANELHSAITVNLGRNIIPRCYVGVVLDEDVKKVEVHYDKAE
jgi:hypothetical protein